MTMKNRARQIFLIIASVILGIILWLYVKTEKEYETDFYFKLRITEIPPKYMIANQIPSTVHIKVKGKGKALLAQKFADGVAEISLKNFSYGKKTITLSEKNFKFVSPEIKLVDIITPKEITIFLDRKITKNVPVKLKVVIEPAEGMYISAPPEVKPPTVTIEGPESRVRTIKYVSTIEDTFRGINTFTSFLVPLKKPDLFVRPIPDTVTVVVQVSRLVDKRFKGIKVIPVGFPLKAGSIEPPTIDVVISGPGDIIEKVTPKDIKAYVKYKDIPPKELTLKRIELTPTVEVPEGINLVKTEPKYVTFIRAENPGEENDSSGN